MEQPATNIVVQYLRTVTTAEAERTDADLLHRYATQHDGEAFALLVRRHGPMVLGVCRRVLGLTPDADDAFQATFLALAKHAARVRDCLGGWLQQVAVRASQRALRRQRPTTLTHDVADVADPFAHTEWRDVRACLDVELARLPEELRTPLVLCYLDGLTRDEAAQRLGWSLRTLHRRLEEGRQRLQQRLTRRGLAPVLLAGFVTADRLRAAVPAALLRHTTALGQYATPPPNVARLVPSMARGGIIMKATLLTFIATLGLIGFGVLTSADAQTPPVKVEEPPQRPATKPKERDPLAESVTKAKNDVLAFLKKAQNADGGWEDKTGPLTTGVSGGGQSCLVVLALLEAGISADEEWLQGGLKFLRTLKPTGVYVMALQTQALCKANQKEDAERIKANVAWLEKAAVRNAGKLEGWTYTDQGGRSDGSNSRYAIAALYTAHKVGFKVAGKDFWTDVANRYMSTQTDAGGWGYTGPFQPTPTMTTSGVLCLHLAYDVLGEQTKGSKAATERGRTWLEDRFKFEHSFPYYHLDVVADMGRAVQRRKFTDRDNGIDWYVAGCQWLFKQQKANGSFQGPAAETPPVASAFALRFLVSNVD